MEKLIIDCKETEYFSRFHLAFHLGNREKARKMALATLVMYRQQARIAHAKSESLWGEIRGLRRSVKKMDTAGMKFPFGEMRIRKLEGERASAEKELAHIGEEIHYMLELWQLTGATFEDLCNLSNIVYRDELKRRLKGARLWVSMVDKALSILDDEEKMVLERLFIHPAKGAVEALCESLSLEKSAVYDRRDKALRHFTLALYGATETE